MHLYKFIMGCLSTFHKLVFNERFNLQIYFYNIFLGWLWAWYREKEIVGQILLLSLLF